MGAGAHPVGARRSHRDTRVGRMFAAALRREPCAEELAAIRRLSRATRQGAASFPAANADERARLAGFRAVALQSEGVHLCSLTAAPSARGFTRRADAATVLARLRGLALGGLLSEKRYGALGDALPRRDRISRRSAKHVIFCYMSRRSVARRFVRPEAGTRETPRTSRCRCRSRPHGVQ